MRVVGFSFIRNAEKFAYPIQEAIRSILPLCDEVVVAVGDSEDHTRKLIEDLGPRVRIIDTRWDPQLRQGGAVLAAETNKALKAIGTEADWCIYIQGDEVLHEDGYAPIREAMLQFKDDTRVDGLLLHYKHFYGSFDYVGTSSMWYRNEIRIIRNNPSIYSYRDAQGFRKGQNEKLRVKPVEAWMYHYGWVRPPEKMQAKLDDFGRHYLGDAWEAPKDATPSGPFAYKDIDSLQRFTGTHPKVMQDWINRTNWSFNYDLSFNRVRFKDRIKNLLEKITGRRLFDYRNYKII